MTVRTMCDIGHLSQPGVGRSPRPASLSSDRRRVLCYSEYMKKRDSILSGELPCIRMFTLILPIGH